MMKTPETFQGFFINRKSKTAHQRNRHNLRILKKGVEFTALILYHDEVS